MPGRLIRLTDHTELQAQLLTYHGPVDRTQAQDVFALLADLKGDLRERQIVERWWLVWVVAGLQIVVTNAVTQWLVWRGVGSAGPHTVVWGTQTLVLVLTIRLIHRRRGGQRSQRERFIWWIWISFLVAAGFVALMNTLLGLPILFTAPMVAVLAAFAWSMMAMAVHRAFAGGVAMFLAAALLMSLAATWQFVIYGGAWAVTLLTLGFYFRPRRELKAAAL